MKKLLSLVLALSMVLSMFATVFAGFADVDGTDYEEAVNALVGLGAINGFPDGTFRPGEAVTRAQLAKMICVCLGLGDAAELSAGTTQFSDVSGWASGYVNVAAANNIITGYPDGSFQPDKEVSYAEAVTMIVRALGYKNVVEVSGSWPANYMVKANDLNLLKGIKISGNTTAAVRGDVALLLWNMLNTEMWVVSGENQTNGISYAKSEEKMIEIKFPNYEVVEEATFVSYSVAYDTKEKENVVKLTINNGTKDISLAYTGNDFYMFLEDEEVTVVYDEEEEEILSISSTQDGEKLAGLVKSFEDEDYYDDLKTSYEDTDYVVFFIEDDELTDLAKAITTTDAYVEEVKEYSTYTKITGISGRITKPERTLVIIDGERGDLTDVEEGVVLTYVDEKFYMISEETVEGTLTKATSTEWTIDGDKYFATSETYKYDEDKDKYVSYTLDTKAKNQDVRLFVSVFGHSVRAEFEELDETATSNDYFVTNTVVYSETTKGKTKYYVDLENANGVETYEVDIEQATNYGDVEEYTFVEVTFDDDVVVAVTVLEEEAYEVKATGSYLYKGEERLGKVASGTQLIKISYDANDDVYTVEFTKGTSEFNKFSSDKVVYVEKNTKNETQIAYVVVRDNNVTSSDLLFGKVTEIAADILSENKVKVTVEDENGDVNEYIFESGDSAAHINEDHLVEGVLVAFVTTEEDDEVYMTIKELARLEDVTAESNVKVLYEEMVEAGRILYNVKDVDGELIPESIIIDLDDDETWETGMDLEEYTFAVVEVEVEEIVDGEVVTGYNLTDFTSFELMGLADVTIEKGQVIALAKVEDIAIIYVLPTEYVDFIAESM